MKSNVFSIAVDDCNYVSKKEQTSLVVRYYFQRSIQKRMQSCCWSWCRNTHKISHFEPKCIQVGSALHSWPSLWCSVSYEWKAQRNATAFVQYSKVHLCILRSLLWSMFELGVSWRLKVSSWSPRVCFFAGKIIRHHIWLANAHLVARSSMSSLPIQTTPTASASVWHALGLPSNSMLKYTWLTSCCSGISVGNCKWWDSDRATEAQGILSQLRLSVCTALELLQWNTEYCKCSHHTATGRDGDLVAALGLLQCKGVWHYGCTELCIYGLFGQIQTEFCQLFGRIKIRIALPAVWSQLTVTVT